MKAQEQPKISPEELARISKAARQVAAYAVFLRWSATFQKDEITRNPKNGRIMLLSPMQSGRFAFHLEGDTLYLGIQSFEAAWFASMPFDKAYVTDRLYLAVEGVGCIDSKLPPLGLGIFVDSVLKRTKMVSAKWLQPIRIAVGDGQVVSIGGQIGSRIPVESGDIVSSLAATVAAKQKQQDISRYF